MGRFQTYIFSSVGQKQLMAISGLGWSVFVLMHMLGNLLILGGAEIYNKYSHALISNPAIILFEIGLLTLLLTHIFYGIRTTIGNLKARKQQYMVSPSPPKSSSLSSRTMIYQGVVILVFVILHLIHFKFGTEYTTTYGNVEMRDLFRLVAETFQSPLYVGFYVLSVFILGFHLSHGLSSSLQSLGFYHDKYQIVVQRLSLTYGLVIALGFSIAPLYIYWFYG